jgi:hypothetical protein
MKAELSSLRADSNARIRSCSARPRCLPGFVALALLASVAWAADSVRNPLRVHPANPRYFTDGTRAPDGTLRAVYLTGAHTWNNFQDMGETDPPAPFDVHAYLDFLVERGHNFIRLWRWELLLWDTRASREQAPRRLVAGPHPWARTGPGTACDGKPRFNLEQFDDGYFRRLWARVAAAADRGLYVSVMLFEGWGLQHMAGAWKAHPFHPSNNINGLLLAPEGRGLEVHTLDVPPVTRLQEAYVRKVCDTLNDFGNVLYEIANEAGAYSTELQYHFIRFIQTYEKRKRRQHPVGMTFQYSGDAQHRGSNATLVQSPADWISPNPEAGAFDYRDNPPPSDGRKVVLADTDHLWGIGGDVAWVWKSFTRGLNPLFMDPYQDTILERGGIKRWEPVRRAMGVTRRLADEIALATMSPRPELASTGYCLAAPGREYVVYLPEGGEVTVDLTAAAGPLEVAWIHPVDGTTTRAPVVQGGVPRAFRAPILGTRVLHLKWKGGSSP